MNQHIPIWKQYGFPSEKEFRKRYPNYGRTQPKAKPKRRQRPTRVIPKSEQIKQDEINNLTRRS